MCAVTSPGLVRLAISLVTIAAEQEVPFTVACSPREAAGCPPLSYGGAYGRG